MRITPENVGNVICMNDPVNYIQIMAVDQEFVHFCTESGNRHSTYNHDFEGFVVSDKERIQEFQKNLILGTALSSAKSRALNSLLSYACTESQRQDAYRVLTSVENMQERLAERLDYKTDRESEKVSHGLSLNDIISRASAGVKQQQGPSMQGIPVGFDR